MEGQDIKKPIWCPKLKEKDKKERTLTYTEKRNKLKELPSQMDWSQFSPGKKYVIPSILGRKRRILLLKYKTDYTLVFNDVNEDDTISDVITNIFKTDVDANFIVEYKNF
jgi:hypothetical protein